MRAFLICLSLLILLALLVPVANTTSFPSQSECPEITIETPSTIICPDARVIFTAQVTKGEVNAQQRFKWTVAEGRVIKGQGTPTITVETTGAQGPGGVRVSVELVGPEIGCALTYSRAVDVTPFCPERKFDEFGEVSEEFEMMKLDVFAIRLRSEPDTVGLIIMYAGEHAPVGYAEARLERARNYLIDVRGLEADQILMKDAGSGVESTMELWVMPTKLPPTNSNQNTNPNAPPPDSNTSKPTGP
jgi:hypothetical protein